MENKCEYGCGKIAKYSPRKGKPKYSCEYDWRNCENIKNKISIRVKESWDKDNDRKIKLREWNLNKWKDETSFFHLKDVRKKIGENTKKYWTNENSNFNIGNFGDKIKVGMRNGKYSLEYYKKKHQFFSKIEEIRYNPDKLDKKEIQGHCKNHKCENSKEKGGWFTLTLTQLHERIRCLERGDDHSYFYCSQKCKDLCPMYNSHGNDPFKENKKIYSESEYQTFRKFVLERDNHICQFCGEKAIDVHHERPQKIEPFFVLDPDYAWSCCEKCHYNKGHKDECSTGNLSKRVC
jgi:hypothetical protein